MFFEDFVVNPCNYVCGVLYEFRNFYESIQFVVIRICTRNFLMTVKSISATPLGLLHMYHCLHDIIRKGMLAN